MKTIIIGGGLAGLTAAADLVDAGADVLVLEKRPVLGGKVSSWLDGEGYPVESGLHIFFGCYRELLAMLKRVDAYKHVLLKRHTINVARRGGSSRSSTSLMSPRLSTALWPSQATTCLPGTKS